MASKSSVSEDTLESESELEKLKKTIDMPLMSREFALMKSERDVMELLSSTWVTNQGLGSMKKTFGMISNASASKTSTLDGLAARIEKMQLDLRKAPGGADFSSQISARPAGGRAKGGRRASLSGSGGGGGGGDGVDGALGGGIKAKDGSNTLPPVPEKAPTNMTATERVEFELSRESNHLMAKCSACGMTVPRERYEEHRSACVAAARRRRKVTEQLGLLESPAQISPCVICGFFFENRNMDSHYRSCLRSKVADKSVVDKLLPAEAPVLPRPPTHIEVVSFTYETVTLSWREPLFRGFMQLTDHVIQVTEVGVAEDANSLVALRKREAAERAKQAKVKKEKEEENAAKMERKRLKRAMRRKRRRERAQQQQQNKEGEDNARYQRRSRDYDSADETTDEEGTGNETETESESGDDAGKKEENEEKMIDAVINSEKKKHANDEDSKLSAPSENRRPGRTWNVATTSFTFVEPLAANGFTVVGLSGDMKYKFAVQSVSAAGPSSFSTEVVEVVTLPPVAPGQCIMFSEDKLIQLRDPTTALALRWLCPDSGGGSDIVDYEISFDLSVVRAKVTDIKFGMRENKRVRLRTGYIEPAPATSDQSDKVTRQGDKYRGYIYRGEVRYILRGLEGGCPYRNIEVRAVNRAGFLSKFSDSIESIVLQSPPREEILLKEYRRALLENKEAISQNLIPKDPKKGGGNTEAFGGNFLDSAFYFSGSFQRFPRAFAIEKLGIELQKLGVGKRAEAIVTEVEGMGEDEGSDWELPSLSFVDHDSVLSDKYNGTADQHLLNAVKAKHTGGKYSYEEIEGQDGDEAEEFVTRSKQYRYKIRQLRKLAEFLQMLAQRNRDTVLGLIPEIRRLEAKARSIEVEHGRVSTFRGMYLDSDSLTGGRSQRFRKQDLLELLNDKVEELMDRVQSRKIDLIILNQESIARIKASVKAWDAYQERASAYFKHRADRTRKLKVWPPNIALMRTWFKHWLWITATKVLHIRGLETIFRGFYQYYASRSFNKFLYQCFRVKPSRLRRTKSMDSMDSPDSAKSSPLLSSRQLGAAFGRRSSTSFQSSSPVETGGVQDDDDDDGENKPNSLGELGEVKKYMSPADEELVNVLKGRESLLDELRSQVARTSHFVSVQKLIDGNGGGAATFFLAEGHRHLPDASKMDAIHKRKQQKLNEMKFGKDLYRDDSEAERLRLEKEEKEEASKMSPKQELIAGLVKCGVVDPLDLATTLFTGNQISWGDISWSFQNEGVGGLKAMLLDVGIDVTSISKIVARFIKERFEGSDAPTTQSKVSGKPKLEDGGAQEDDDDDDNQLAAGMAKSPTYMLTDEEIQNLPDESRKVALRWMDDEEDLGSFDIALQRIISLMNIGDFQAADDLCKQVHAKCPAPKGLDITGGLPSGAKEPSKAPLPCSEEELNETLYLSLSQQSMLWLQQAKAQKGLFLTGKTEVARNKGQIGAELEYALFCIDEAIDRAKGWAAVDEKEDDEDEDEDEEEAARKEKESERIEAEEIAAAKAAGVTFRKKQSSLASKAKKKRDEIKRKTLQGEEWSSDALLFWAFEVKGDTLCLLEAHEEAIDAFKLGLRHLLLLRKKRAINAAAQITKATQEALGMPPEKVKEAVAAAVTAAAIQADSEAAGDKVSKSRKKEDEASRKKRIGGIAEEAELCAKIGRQYRRSNDDARAQKWEVKSSQIKNRNRDKRVSGRNRLDYLYEKLLDDAKAELATDVALERCSNKVPELRLRRLANIEEVEDSRDSLAVAMEDAGGRSAQLIGAQADLEFAIKSEADTVESSAFGASATYPVEEFRVLVERQVLALGKEQGEALARVRKEHLAINNLLDEIEDLEALLKVEAGPLMQRAVQRQHLIRCMCANSSNLMANDVSGKASGGVSLIAVGVDNYAAVYDIETGALMQVLFGEKTKTGERPNGHSAKITAIFFLAYRLYTGDHDGIIMVWNISDGRGGLSAKKKKKTKKEAAEAAKEGNDTEVGSTVFTPASGVVSSAQCVVEVLDDHDNSITAISADEEKLISAAADLTIKVWNAEIDDSGDCSYDLLFTLRGHAKSVNFIGIGDFTFATGDAAGQVRVWELMKSAKVGGVDEKVTEDSDDSDEVAKYSRCRCILKVRHNRSEDAPENKSVELSADEALAERLRSLHSDGNFKLTAVQEAAMMSRDGGNMTRECEALKVKKFLSREPGPEGRIRTHGITCLEYYGAELTCGDVHGKVFIWNISEKKCMWDIQAHRGRVSALQVDAVRVVTGGADGLIRIFDIMTGRAVQSFQLLTGGADGRLMRWLWSTAAEGEKGEKLIKHFVAPGDSLPSISVKYGTPLKSILEWNNLKDGRDLYGGMSLIVAKEVAGDKIKNNSLDPFQNKPSGKNNSNEVNLRNKPTEQTLLFHPLYGLKSMEANIYKGRAPRKGEENGEGGNTSVLEKARQMSKKSNVIDKVADEKAQNEAKEAEDNAKTMKLLEEDIEEVE